MMPHKRPTGACSPLRGLPDRLIHGGEYVAELWSPEIWREDFVLMKEAGWNSITLGTFAWGAIEPGDGEWNFSWMDDIFELAEKNEIDVVLSTPTSSPPVWMCRKYPEMLRVGKDGRRMAAGARKRYCLSSPVYREQCQRIAAKLAERYGSHPRLCLWHIGNEYGHDECYSEITEAAFREWLKGQFPSLDELNRRWGTTFWAQTYRSWDEIETPRPGIGNRSIMGLNNAWFRFNSHLTFEAIREQILAIRPFSPEVASITNFYWWFSALDFSQLPGELDYVSWDNYPAYLNQPSDADLALGNAFFHDSYRCVRKDRPFLLMESCPGSHCETPYMRAKRPGVLEVSSLQAIAHGSNSVQYFQWRKGLGCAEQHHGAVVDHAGRSDSRIFRSVARVGESLKQLRAVADSLAHGRVAIICDPISLQAVHDAIGPRKEGLDAMGDGLEHYRALRRWGLTVDVLHAGEDFQHYDLVVAPMLYRLSTDDAERMKAFVSNGGTLVTTYWSGVVNEDCMVHPGGSPGPLREVLGISSEELDCPALDERKAIVVESSDLGTGLVGTYEARHFCDVVRLEGAEVLARYADDFYADSPALTRHRHGRGEAYYLCSRNDRRFLDDFYSGLVSRLGLTTPLRQPAADGIGVCLRESKTHQFLFLQNFLEQPAQVALASEAWVTLSDGHQAGTEVPVKAYETIILSQGLE